MTPQQEIWEQARVIFDTARGLPEKRRESYLREACTDPALREELRSLLQAHVSLETGSGQHFLDSLDSERAAALLASGKEPVDPAESEELRPGQMLGRYRIERRLGRGGMGVVYLAHDPRLNRPVAIKLLPRYLSLDDTARRRLEAEARAASALDHPSIVTIYEIGEAEGGQVFIAMAYYEGETLRRRLERGPLPVAEALALAARIAEGLAAAHAQGIVHRDVKPGNILVTPDGSVRIVDFGIARAAGSAPTRTGAALGTVAYMSPEQTRGEAVAPGTDVWSLGVTLYEMLTGQRPFRAENEQALVYAIRHDEPEPLQQVRPEVPDAAAGIVERCLRKEPAERYQDAGALLDDLRAPETLPAGFRGLSAWRRSVVRYAGAVGIAGAMLLAGIVLWQRAQDAETGAGRPAATLAPVSNRLAVLPLDNFSPDPEDAYLADGLTEQLISRLSRLSGLQVIARTSVMRYRGTDAGIADIGRELDVGAVLEGSVRKSDDRVRITVQLIDVTSQEHLWSEDYDARLVDVLALQQQIAERVAEALQLKLGTGEHRVLAKRDTQIPDAYTEYMMGRYFLGKLDRASFLQARDHFQRALDLDPLFPQAWSSLADAYNHLTSVQAMRALDLSPRARAAAERALELDPDLAEAHAALALVLSMHYWDSASAERHFLRALELDPSYAMARRNYATHLRNLGRFDEALVQARKAQELDPLSVFPRLEEGIILFVARRYDEVIAHCLSLLGVNPNSPLAHLLLAKAYAATARFEEALATLQKGDPDATRPGHQATLGYIYGLMGRQDDARQMLQALDTQPIRESVTGFHKSVIHIALCEHDQALDLLEQAAEERTWLTRLLGVEPIFDPLRNEPRFRALLQRVGLEDARRTISAVREPRAGPVRKEAYGLDKISLAVVR